MRSFSQLRSRMPSGGESNDCIWISSSLTIPPLPESTIRLIATEGS